MSSISNIFSFISIGRTEKLIFDYKTKQIALGDIFLIKFRCVVRCNWIHKLKLIIAWKNRFTLHGAKWLIAPRCTVGRNQGLGLGSTEIFFWEKTTSSIAFILSICIDTFLFFLLYITPEAKSKKRISIRQKLLETMEYQDRPFAEQSVQPLEFWP